MAKTIKVGTRKSSLALTQTDLVIKKLKEKNPDIDFQIVGMNTKGDQVHHKPLRDIFEDGKSAFTSEIQKALKRGEIDIAVHSMKDVAGNMREEELVFAAFLKRESAADVIILKDKTFKNLKELPAGYVVGTVSARRKAALLRSNPELIVKNLRGNVQTRIAKLKGMHVWTEHKPLAYDAILMAESAIIRSGDNLDLSDLFYFKLSYDEMLPAAGQGTIGVECRADNKNCFDLLRQINHAPTERITIVEREFLYELGGNCHTVIGAYAEISGGNIILKAEISDEAGNNLYQIEKSSEDGHALGKQAAQSLKDKIIKDKGEKFLYEILNLTVK